MGAVPRRVQGRWKWHIGERLAEGGIGAIHEAWRDGDKRDAYVGKLVPVEPGAEREFLLEEVSDARNVVPVVDSAETDDYYVLIMPRASRSLADLLDTSGKIDADDAVRIATDVAVTLTDLDGRVVHRDLKPGNILFLGGSWCLTDFGISRYAEAATAPGTRKSWMSRQYAAPEQWRHEHATSAADVYALGRSASPCRMAVTASRSHALPPAAATRWPGRTSGVGWNCWRRRRAASNGSAQLSTPRSRLAHRTRHGHGRAGSGASCSAARS